MIIYSMARSKSTAALEAAKREVLLNEPFNLNKLVNDETLGVVDKLDAAMDYPHWDKLANTMSQSNTASKFFGTCIHSMPKAREWFAQIDKDKSHEIFCLIRSPKETMLSHILAMFFGYHTLEETENVELTINDNQLMFLLEPSLHMFLKYYPKNATTVTFDTLPSEHFDYGKINITTQNSIERRQHCITNLEEVKRKIDIFLRFHQREWEEKTGTDIFA